MCVGFIVIPIEKSYRSHLQNKIPQRSAFSGNGENLGYYPQMVTLRRPSGGSRGDRGC